MSGVFNLPQGITSVGAYFAAGMFGHCGGAGFVMNGVFNLPPSLTGSVGNNFASSMFANCGGSSFVMNGVFNLPSGYYLCR